MDVAATRHWAAIAAAGGGMVGGALLAMRSRRLQHGDVRVHDALAQLDEPVLDRVVIHTTDLGSVYAVVGCAAALWASGRRRTSLDVAASGATAWVIAQRVKGRVSRERPYEAYAVRRLIGRPTGSSFPSGHACVATTVATVLASRTTMTGARRWLYGVACWVAATRVYVGVHYPTDVVGGAGLGLAFGALWRGPMAALGRRLLARLGLVGTQA